MRKKLIMIVITGIVIPHLFAQSTSQNSKRMKPPSPRPGAFLNMSRPTKVSGDGMTTPSGVKYWDIQKGDGDPAVKGHVVKILYTAWIAENGKEFASSAGDARPTVFTVGAGQVIKGWEDGVEGMKPGGKRQFRVPADLAYGTAGVPPLVPPNATLIFDVVLIEVQ